MQKLLAIDLGNSAVKFGLFRGGRLVRAWRMASHSIRLPRIPGVDGIIVSSVIPRLNRPLRLALRRRFKREPIFVTPHVSGPIKIRKRKPESGADRIANAVAAYPFRPAIVIDVGTITTFDVISRRGELVGAAFFPGPKIVNDLFHRRTAKLPKVPLATKRKVLGNNTKEVMQAGLFHGYGALVDGMIERIRSRYGRNLRVIATGGLAQWVARSSKLIQKTDSSLTLKGLKAIYCSRFLRKIRGVAAP